VTRKQKAEKDGEIIRVSNFNRGVMVIILMLVAWEALEVYKIRVQTRAWQTEITGNKVAIEANTKEITDSIKAWNNSQQAMSNWMKANQQAVDLLHQKNPKLKVPKAPPIPPELPPPDKIIPDSVLIRPALSTPSKPTKRHKARPTATPSFLDRLFRPKSTRSEGTSRASAAGLNGRA
jgi:hypothetical protein